MRKLFEKIIYDKLHIAESELYRLSFIALLFFLMFSVIISSNIISDAYFFSRFDISILPKMFIVNSLLLIMISLGGLKFIDKINRYELLKYSILINILILLILLILINFSSGKYVLLEKSAKLIYYVYNYLLKNYFVIVIWLFASDIFDTRQAKRLFPFVGATGLIGYIITSLTVSLLLKMVGAFSMFIALIVLCLVIFFVLLKNSKIKQYIKEIKSEPAQEENKADKSNFISEIANSNIIIILIINSFFLFLLFNSLDYFFYFKVKATYANANDIGSFIGSFKGIYYALALTFQIFLTQKIIDKIGVHNALSITSIVLTAGYFFHIFHFTFVTIVLFQLFVNLVLSSIHSTSYQVVYNLFSTAMKGKVKSFLEGIVRPVGIILAGLLIPVLVAIPTTSFNPEGTYRIFFIILVVLSFISLILVLKLKKAYIEKLLQNLQTGDVNQKLAALNSFKKLKNDKTISLLKDMVFKGNDDIAHFSLDTLKLLGNRSDIVSFLDNLELLSDKKTLKVLQIMVEENINDKDVIAKIIELFNKLTSSNKAIALTIIGTSDEHKDFVKQFINSNIIELQSTSLKILLCSDGFLPEYKQIVDKWWDRGIHVNTLLKLIYDCDLHEYIPQLLVLFEKNTDPEIQKLLLDIFTKFKVTDIIPQLIYMLKNSKYTTMVYDSLINFGTEIESVLLKNIKNNIGDSNLVLKLLKVLSEIKVSEKSLELLEYYDKISIKNYYLYSKTLYKLKTYIKDDEKHFTKIETIISAFIEKLHFIYYIKTKSDFIEFNIIQKSFTESLNRRIKGIVESVLLLLEIVCELDKFKDLFSLVFSNDNEKKAYAIETIDNVIPKQYSEQILPIIEDRKDKIDNIAQNYKFKPINSLNDFNILLDIKDFWLNSLVAYLFYRLNIKDYVDKILSIPDYNNNVLKELKSVIQKKYAV